MLLGVNYSTGAVFNATPAYVETVQGGVPPYGVKETLVVNGKKISMFILNRLMATLDGKCLHGLPTGVAVTATRYLFWSSLH